MAAHYIMSQLHRCHVSWLHTAQSTQTDGRLHDQAAAQAVSEYSLNHANRLLPTRYEVTTFLVLTCSTILLAFFKSHQAGSDFQEQ
jgi:hypothetical protein